MFNRAQNFAHVCLRCQWRLARQGQQRNLNKNRAVSPRQRFQSTAAAQVEEEDDDQGEHPLVLDFSDIPSADIPPKKSPGRYKYRKWRPSPTAKLGVNALGKPSEIIMLSQRNRAIPVVPDGPEEEAKESLHDSITSEKQPLSWEDAKSNINQAREQLDQERGQLTLVQWEELSKTLRKGFSKGQLRRYVNEMWSRSPEESAAAKINKASRPKMAYFIANKIWGFELPAEALATLSKEDRSGLMPTTEPETDPVRTLSWNLPKYAIPCIRPRLNSLAKEHGVKLYTQQSRLFIRGPKDRGASAQAAMKALTKSLTFSLITGESWSHQFQGKNWSEDKVHNLMASLRLRYGLSVTAEARGMKTSKGHAFKVWYLPDQKDLLPQIRRDLRKAALSTMAPATAYTPIYDSEPKTNLKLIAGPSYSTSSPIQDSSHQLYRLYGASSQSTSTSGQDAEVAARNAIEYSLYHKSPVDVEKRSQHDISLDYTASFGQVLFRLSKNQLPFERVKKDAKPIFTTAPVLTPQLLLHSRYQQPGLPRLPHFADDQARSLIRVRLAPDEPNSRAPVFEMYLQGSDMSAGLLQELQIARADAIIEERSHLVPRPNKALDLKFTRRSKLKLFDLKTPTSVVHAILCQQLRDYVKSFPNQPPLYVRFHVPAHMLQNTEKKKKSKAAAKPKADTNSDDVHVRYVLDSMDVLDIDARLASSPTGTSFRFNLEHITAQGGQFGSDSQELLLGHVTPASVSFDFKHFFKAAIDIADRIDSLGRQLRHRLEGSKG